MSSIQGHNKASASSGINDTRGVGVEIMDETSIATIAKVRNVNFLKIIDPINLQGFLKLYRLTLSHQLLIERRNWIWDVSTAIDWILAGLIQIFILIGISVLLVNDMIITYFWGLILMLPLYLGMNFWWKYSPPTIPMLTTIKAAKSKPKTVEFEMRRALALRKTIFPFWASASFWAAFSQKKKVINQLNYN